MGLAAHVSSRSVSDTQVAVFRPTLAMIENDIRALLDAPSVGADAPNLARIQDTLTAGYARAMALEADQWRLQRLIADTAMRLADDPSEVRTAELKRLARDLKRVESDLVGIRDLIASLRARASAAQAA